MSKLDKENAFQMLKLKKDDFLEISSYYGLDTCYYIKGIRVHVSSEKIIFDISGQGCRLIETLYNNQLDWMQFIGNILSREGSHISRLDIAGDDKPINNELPQLSFKKLEKHSKENRYISLAKRVIWIGGAEQNIVYGAPSSERRLRIYNKALERSNNGKQYDGHWIRLELQMRNDSALEFYMTALQLGSIGKAYSAILYNYLRFTKEENTGMNTNRMIVCRWWQNFLGVSKKIKTFKVGGLEYNMQTLENVLFRQCASSLYTYIRLKEGDISELIDNAMNTGANKRQQFLIDTKPLIDKMNTEYQNNFKEIAKENSYINSEIEGKNTE